MTKNADIVRVETGVRNLDALLNGGLPAGTVTVVAGSPGAGKTILAQQICFHNASAETKALYFGTLSEPTAKTLRHLSQFTFFDAKKMDGALEFVDLGGLLHDKQPEGVVKLVMDHVKRLKPGVVVIDSFKVFDDLAPSRRDLRRFGYDLAVQLMAWETTAFLLGEYGAEDIATNPLFSIVDGLFLVTQRERSGEQQRFIQILKMRGTNHSRDENPFLIGTNGIEVFAPRVTIQREDRGLKTSRCKTGISKLDDLLGEGIPRGSSLLVAGVAGTGKTVLLLEFIYRGALAGEKGLIFSFEETSERLRAAAQGLGWDFEAQLARGMIEIVFIPQPDILVEKHLLMMRERIEGADIQRVVVDSLSVFLHKVADPQLGREKTFQLASIVQNAQAVGLFATDIPYGSSQISRFGVEETVVDGVILLTSTEEGFERQRYLEVYKLRNTAHSKGRHNIVIGAGGVQIFPRYASEGGRESREPLDTSRRLPSGVDGLDALIGGGLIRGSVTLLSGTAGAGKTTVALQFVLAGAKQEERSLYVALEEGLSELLRSAAELALPLQAAIDRELVEVVCLSREHVRANQLLTVLAEKIRTSGAHRLALDSASYLMTEGLPPLDARQVLRGLIAGFKKQGVTSCFTLEVGPATPPERGLSSLADNVISLRSVETPDGLKPTLTVVKTRASRHDFGIHDVVIAKGGLRIQSQRRTFADPDAPKAARRGPSKVSSKRTRRRR